MKKKMRLLVVICLLGSFASLSAQGLKTYRIEQPKIKIKVPAEFYPMIPEDIVQRFPSVRKPIAAFTNEERTADLTLKISATQWEPEDVEIAMSFFKSSIYDLFDKVEIKDEGIIENSKDNYAYLIFISFMRGTPNQLPERKYNYITYRFREGKTLVMSFRCLEKEYGLYRDRVDDIMEDIKIKGI